MILHVFKPKRLRAGKSQASRLYSGRYRLNGSGPITTIPLGTSDKQVATERLRKHVAEIEREGEGLIPAKALRDAGQKALSLHLDDLLAAKSAAGRDERYLYELKNRVLRLLRGCGWALAKDVTAESFTAWRNRQTQSARTLNEYLTSMRTLLNWMEGKGLLSRNPLKSVEAPSTRHVAIRPRRAFSDEAMRQLLDVAGPRRIVYQTSALTGLRRGEMDQLQRGDLRLDTARPHIVARASTTKNGKQAIIPLHPELAEALRAHLASLLGQVIGIRLCRLPAGNGSVPRRSHGGWNPLSRRSGPPGRLSLLTPHLLHESPSGGHHTTRGDGTHAAQRPATDG